MYTRKHVSIWALIVWAGTAAAVAESHLMRVADVHEDRIVFTYEDDLWIVGTEGGPARRLTNDPGTEIWAKFSPCGKWIAFTGQYDGGVDVYVIAAEGGVPRRLTYHPSSDRVLEWWPDGKWVVFRSNRAYPNRGEEVYRVSVEGGMPERLPVDRAGLTTISPDGKQIAYNRQSRESRTWKRHRGGTAQDIWMGSLDQMDYRKIIDTDWTDNFPMWHGDHIYFNSDREHGTLNLYRYDTRTTNIKPLTAYTDYDVKYPSIGPRHIVFQYAESLHLLDLETGQVRKVPVEIPSDLVSLRPEFVRASPSTGSFGLSPSGVRMVLEARGEILNFPVEDGEPINLTKSPGSREKNATWSPDGRWIAFISDRTGEEELYLVDQKGGPWKQITKNGLGFRMQPVWSPDSKYLMFSDKFMRLYLVDVAAETVTLVDTADYDDAWERWGIQDYVFSPCSQWIAYTKMEQSLYESIFLYSIKDGTTHRLTSDQTQDWSPSFSPDGQYLYFLSNRTFDPIMGVVDQNHIFLDMTRPYLVLLQADAESPFAPQDSAEEVKEDEPAEAPAAEEAAEAEAADESADEEDAGEVEEAEEDEAKDEGTRIDLEGIERRVLVAGGVPAGTYFRLEATKKGFLYVARTEPVFSKYDFITDQTGERVDLYHYDLGEDSTSEVMGGINNYHLSADGEKMVYRSGSTYGVVGTGSKSKVGDGKVDLDGIRIEVVRAEEFRQMFDEAWRIQRDWFYDPNLHGVDWEAMREKYGKFVPYCADRSDLNYLIGEMIAELNIGHTYVYGGDLPSNARRVATGLLGADFVADPGAAFYRIAHIIPTTPGDPGARSPLDEPGCPIEEGHYLIAIDGVEVPVGDNIYRHLQNKRGRVVTVTYNDQPTAENAKTFRLETIGGEDEIRYREWVDRCRRQVEEATGGTIGYLHLPDMMTSGLIEFAKAWYPQYMKQGFIIDARYNGGGFTGDMIIDRLERELWGLTQPREGKILRDPEQCFLGPWVVLINEDTGSNGEMFAEAIKIKRMAPIIGMRTWGGSIGIEPHQDLVDGGGVTPPQFGLYGLDRRWLIEGVGVVPDIEVQNMPGDVMRGRDAQLERGIEEVKQRVRSKPIELPPAPPYPDKSRPRGS